MNRITRVHHNDSSSGIQAITVDIYLDFTEFCLMEKGENVKTLEEIEVQVLELVAQFVDKPDVTIELNSDLTESGLDSLDLMEIGFKIDDIFNLEVDPRELVGDTPIRTVGGLAKHIEQKLNSA
ncbi:MAG: acyl carrier protein [Pseudomonadota bacterium]